MGDPSAGLTDGCLGALAALLLFKRVLQKNVTMGEDAT